MNEEAQVVNKVTNGTGGISTTALAESAKSDKGRAKSMPSAHPLFGSACIHCKRPCAEKSAVWKGQGYCRKCKRLAREPKECQYCGRLSPAVYTSRSAGLDKPACMSCVGKAKPRCDCCKRVVKVTCREKDGSFCRVCCQRRIVGPQKCNSCGKTSLVANTRDCRGCRANRHAFSSVKVIAKSLATPWVRELFVEFIEQCGGEARGVSSLARARESREGFLALEHAFAGVDEFTLERVFEILTPGGNHTRSRALRRFLEARFGLKLRPSDCGEVAHKRFADRMLAGKPAWMLTVLRDFLDHLYAQREKLLRPNVARSGVKSWKSMDLALRYGYYVLESAMSDGCSSIAELGQKHVDRFCVERRSTISGAAAFVRYLNATTHRVNRLRLAKQQKGSTLNHHLGEPRFLCLLSELLATKEAVASKYASIALLCMLHLRPLGAILSITRDQVEDDGRNMRIHFTRGSTAESVNVEVARILRFWVAAWSSPSRSVSKENNPYLFPGLSPNKALDPHAFQAWLKSVHDVTVRQLTATGIHVMISRGMISPAALVDQYGWSHATALRYWNDSGQISNEPFRAFSQRIIQMNVEGS